MFCKLSVALLIAVTPAVAQEASPPNTEGAVAEAPKPVAYKTKKICRSIEVVGSSIPKRSCSTKRVPIEPPVEEDAAGDASASESDSDI